MMSAFILLLLLTMTVVPGIAFGQYIYRQLLTGDKIWYGIASILCGIMAATAILQWITWILKYFLNR